MRGPAKRPDVLPPLYAKWASQFLSEPIPAETEATCSDCAMLCTTPGTARPDAAAPFFDPSTKCCTYLPVLPNFLVGGMLADDSPAFAQGRATLEARLAAGVALTPLGTGRSAADDLLYVANAKSFGRLRSMRCPHYLEEGGGQCGIWRHRAAVCATWYCKYVRGAVGQRFWQTLHRLLTAVERDLSRWCARELGVEGQQAFGRWSGRERQFFKACARLVAALGWRDVQRICAPEVRQLTTLTRAAFDRLRSRAIPRQLRVGAFTVIAAHRHSSIVEGYDGGDRLALPNEVLDALHYFDASASAADAVRTIRAQTGLALERDLVRLLVDFEVLIPAGRRA